VSEGEEDSPHYVEEKEFETEEFKRIFSAKYAQAIFDVNPENWVSNIARSDAGGIKSLSVGGVSVKGSEMRSLFGLKSTNFTLLYDSGKMKFKTKGYGHGVGMSQYGARAKALSGAGYEEILKSYYTGVELGKINQKIAS
jgi:stage II sporulation protein D